jgi:hypothetical protein
VKTKELILNRLQVSFVRHVLCWVKLIKNAVDQVVHAYAYMDGNQGTNVFTASSYQPDSPGVRTSG